MISIVRRVAMVCAMALGATLLWFRRMENGGTRSRVVTIPVVVAAKDIPEAMSIDRVAVTVAQWPVGTQPAGAYTSVDSVANRVTRVAISKGEAIVPGRLAPEARRRARGEEADAFTATLA